jgi:hypothetical protein
MHPFESLGARNFLTGGETLPLLLCRWH